MRDKYQEDLEKLNANILKMGKMIEIAIESTIIALMGRDTQAAVTVSENDEAIDNMEREIEGLCMKLLLQQQPVATDLRVITAALKMVTDMERIGDHASDIAELVLQIPDCKYNKMDTITEISTQIINMIHKSIKSFINRNYDMAQVVIAQDDIVDNLYHEIKTDLIQKIKKTDDGEQILDYLLIARYFERIGDHATNIAKWVVFAITGKK
mgnify:FL=1